MRFITALIGLVLALGYAGQGAAGEARVEGEFEAKDPARRGEPGVFAYSGAFGPLFWGDIQPRSGQGANACASGSSQSPIDFQMAEIGPGNAGDIEIHYSPAELKIENLGTTLEVPYENGSYIMLDGDRYDLLQFHFHTPSEHTVEGASYPLEIHFVHRLSDTQFAVLGAMVTQGRPNRALLKLGDQLELDQLIPRNENVDFIFPELEIDAEELLPEEHSFYRYSGSLTTPPCSEVVLWSVFTQPIEMSIGQIRVLRNALGDLRFSGLEGQNNRPTQPVNGREVTIND